MNSLKSLSKKNLLINLFVVAVVGWFFIIPILRLILLSIRGETGIHLETYAQLWAEGRTRKAVVNTLVISVASTGFAALIGGFLAFVVAYTDIRFKKLLEILILSPLILPGYVLTLAMSNLFLPQSFINTLLKSIGVGSVNLYSIGGIVFLCTITTIPLVYISTIRRLRKIPIDLEWASQICGHTKRSTYMKIHFVQVFPAWISGAILAFLATIDNFSIPAFLGIPANIPVLSTYIYEKAIGFGPGAFQAAACLSMMLSGIVILFLGFQWFFKQEIGRLKSVPEDRRPRIHLKKRNRVLLGALLLGIFVIVIVFPFVLMVLTSFAKFYGKIDIFNLTLSHYQFVFTNTGVHKAIMNSLVLATVASLITMALSIAFAYLKMKNPKGVIRFSETFISIPYALPGIVLALAMIFHWSSIPNVYGTYRILLIAYITRYLILQIKGSTIAFLSVHKELVEASHVSGGTRVRTWSKIILPIIMPQVFMSTLSVFVAALTELTLSSLLSAAGSKTIGLSVFGLQQGGDYNLSYALSTVVVTSIIIGYVLVSYITRRRVRIEHAQS